MRKARVFVHDIEAGILEEITNNTYLFTYHSDYQGAPVSLTMPLQKKNLRIQKISAFF